jgi:hypothetical protein
LPIFQQQQPDVLLTMDTSYDRNILKKDSKPLKPTKPVPKTSAHLLQKSSSQFPADTGKVFF